MSPDRTRKRYLLQERIGRRFGRLTVEGFGRLPDGRPLLHCRCDCGRTITASLYQVARGKLSHCGCDPSVRVKISAAQRVGLKYGRLTIMAPAGSKKSHALALCRCDCGNECVTAVDHLLIGHTTSCGCFSAEWTRKRFRTHGLSKSREYHIWQGMHNRCKNPDCEKYPHYGGRGIRVCERWESFAAFIEDVGLSPSPKHEIERVDNNGHYEPGNCRWATHKEQMRNTRRNRLITFRGETLPLVVWSERTGLNVPAITHRLKIGWPVELALTTPLGVSRKRGWPDGTPSKVSSDNLPA
jgi:hypothetical protein